MSAFHVPWHPCGAHTPCCGLHGGACGTLAWAHQPWTTSTVGRGNDKSNMPPSSPTGSPPPHPPSDASNPMEIGDVLLLVMDVDTRVVVDITQPACV